MEENGYGGDLRREKRRRVELEEKLEEEKRRRKKVEKDLEESPEVAKRQAAKTAWKAEEGAFAAEEEWAAEEDWAAEEEWQEEDPQLPTPGSSNSGGGAAGGGTSSRKAEAEETPRRHPLRRSLRRPLVVPAAPQPEEAACCARCATACGGRPQRAQRRSARLFPAEAVPLDPGAEEDRALPVLCDKQGECFRAWGDEAQLLRSDEYSDWPLERPSAALWLSNTCARESLPSAHAAV